MLLITACGLGGFVAGRLIAQWENRQKRRREETEADQIKRSVAAFWRGRKVDLVPPPAQEVNGG